MATDEPDRNDPLSPYFPDQVPSIPSAGRRWVALLLLVLVFSGFFFSLLFWLLGTL